MFRLYFCGWEQEGQARSPHAPCTCRSAAGTGCGCWLPGH